MKIGQPSDLASHVTQANTQKAGEEAVATAKSAATSAGVSVSVSVSSTVRALQKPEAASQGDVDTAKVERIKAAIQSGTYTVNPEAIADNLLSNAQEMLNRTRN